MPSLTVEGSNSACVEGALAKTYSRLLPHLASVMPPEMWFAKTL